jgi:hypothetical protein
MVPKRYESYESHPSLGHPLTSLQETPELTPSEVSAGIVPSIECGHTIKELVLFNDLSKAIQNSRNLAKMADDLATDAARKAEECHEARFIAGKAQLKTGRKLMKEADNAFMAGQCTEEEYQAIMEDLSQLRRKGIQLMRGF